MRLLFIFTFHLSFSIHLFHSFSHFRAVAVRVCVFALKAAVAFVIVVAFIHSFNLTLIDVIVIYIYRDVIIQWFGKSQR